MLEDEVAKRLEKHSKTEQLKNEKLKKNTKVCLKKN